MLKLFSPLYSCSVDDGFPVVKFHFEGSLTLTVYPHDYLFQIRVSRMVLKIDEDLFIWCFFFMIGTFSKVPCMSRLEFVSTIIGGIKILFYWAVLSFSSADVFFFWWN